MNRHGCDGILDCAVAFAMFSLGVLIWVAIVAAVGALIKYGW